MATTTYIYPRVNISTNAKTHSSVQPEAEDTTRLFVPLLTEKGPDKVITRVRSMGEFSDIFGSLDYERNGQMALNLYNWLTYGGTAYIYNLNGTDKDEGNKAKKASLKFKISADDLKTDTLSNNVESLETLPEVLTEYDEGKILILNTTDYYIVMGTGSNKKATKIEKVEYEYFLDDKEVSEFEYDKTYNKKIKYKDKLYDFATVKLESKDKTFSEAKYYGTYYNDVSVVISPRSENSFDLKIYHVDSNTQIKTLVEEYSRLKIDSYKKALAASEYIDAETFDVTESSCFNNEKFDTSKTDNIQFSGAEECYTKDTELLANFWSETAPNILKNDLAYPIDMILDAGYSKTIKVAMLNFISNGELVSGACRTDIIGLFDAYILPETTTEGIYKAPTTTGFDKESTTTGEDTLDINKYKGTNIAIYEQYFKINDAVFTDSDIYVTPTYFLSKLIPENDLQYGIQFATAGIRRGVLTDATAINENPLPAKKNEWFINRINYAEKTPRECAFMSQRTFDGSTEDRYTALSFLNNARCLEKMKKDIERLGRDYLFEFNDSTTLAQMSNVLNKYITDWISNRTLSKGIVTVSKNAYSDEAVDVNLTIRFNGTIEVISVDIVIE